MSTTMQAVTDRLDRRRDEQLAKIVEAGDEEYLRVLGHLLGRLARDQPAAERVQRAADGQRRPRAPAKCQPSDSRRIFFHQID